MLTWITDYISYVENRPQDFNNDVKNNVRQIKELLSRPCRGKRHEREKGRGYNA